MAKVSFDPIIQWITGRIGKLVYRRSHNGKVSTYPKPDMSRVKWSRAQIAHRQRMKQAWKYASAAVADPDIRPVYVQMAIEWGKNPKRPYDTAVRDYTHGGEDLLWKKHMGDQPKPADWDIDDYPWYSKKSTRRRHGRNPSPLR